MSSPSAILMSDSARQPAVEMFVTVASPSSSPEENPIVQRSSTRRAFLIFCWLMICRLSCSRSCRVLVVVLAPWVVGMLFRGRGRHKLLSWQDDVAWFTLLGQVFRNFRMVGSHIADKPAEEPL